MVSVITNSNMLSLNRSQLSCLVCVIFSRCIVYMDIHILYIYWVEINFLVLIQRDASRLRCVLQVLERAQKELLSYQNTGISVMGE